MRLIEITRAGEPAEAIAALPDIARAIGTAYVSLYSAQGFVPPWLGYFAMEEEMCVGTCGFKSPPEEGRVELAYFTFPSFERRGYATRMARELICVARSAQAGIIIRAQTLPLENFSTAILRRLQFSLIGTVDHPDDGPVWEWQLTSPLMKRSE